jgi:hypothetical protein
MNPVVYLIAAYVGAAMLYLGYLAWIRRTERVLERRIGGPAR